jgi:hypothetical protein
VLQGGALLVGRQAIGAGSGTMCRKAVQRQGAETEKRLAARHPATGTWRAYQKEDPEGIDTGAETGVN